jgi:hypothetical protein
LDLSHQARFANACLPRKQDNLPLSAFRSIYEQAEGGEIMHATDQDRAQDRVSKWCLHRIGLSAENALQSFVTYRFPVSGSPFAPV